MSSLRRLVPKICLLTIFVVWYSLSFANTSCNSNKVSSSCPVLPPAFPKTTLLETQQALESIKSRTSDTDLIDTINTLEKVSLKDRIDGYLSIALDESGQLSDSITKLNGLNTSAVAGRVGAVRNIATGSTSGIAALSDQSLTSELFVLQGGSAGEENFSRFGVYTRFDYDNGTVDSTLNQAGYDFDGYGITVGGDYTFNKSYLVGASVGFPFYENDFDTPNTKTDIDGFIFTGYFSYFLNSWYLDLTASYSALQLDMKREIIIGTDNLLAKADDVDSDIWSFSLGGGYLFDYELWSFNTEAMFQYTTSETDGYTEEKVSGNAEHLLLDVDKVDDLSSTQLIIGGTASYPFNSNIGVIQPYARGYIHYEFEDGSNQIVTRFSNDTSGVILPVITDEPDSFYGRAHIGVSGIFINNWRGYAEASTLLGLENTSAYTLTLGVNLDF